MESHTIWESKLCYMYESYNFGKQILEFHKGVSYTGISKAIRLMKQNFVDQTQMLFLGKMKSILFAGYNEKQRYVPLSTVNAKFIIVRVIVP